AVNNNVAAEVVNGLIRFFDATTGAPKTPPIALFYLFDVFDIALDEPQALFDPITSRWFFDAVMLDFLDNPIGFAVAVSQTSDPLGKYFVYQISDNSSNVPGCGGRNCLLGFPKAGYDANGFYLAANLFNKVGSAFVESAIYALPKSKLEA